MSPRTSPTVPAAPTEPHSAALESLAALRERVAADRIRDLPAPRVADRLATLAREGFGFFAEQDVPTRRLERFKGTNLAPLAAMHFDRVGAARDADAPDATPDDVDLLFVDGHLLPASPARATLPAGVRVLSLAEAAIDAPELLETRLGALPDLKQNSLTALQTALFEDVAVVHLEARANPGRPIRIRSIATAATAATTACFPRLLVVAERESAATIYFESDCRGHAPGLTAFVAEYHLADGARIEAVQIQAESAERVHYTSAHARLERDAHFDSHVLSLGDGLLRSELDVTLAAPGGETRLRGFFLGRGDAHLDHFTTVDHAAAHCTSDEEYRGVLGDGSHGVFRGLVQVRPGAQKTDARQSNPNLLLSDRATIDTKPQLEIYADDVKASHGSTIGQLDEDALFFLRARGIDEAVARLVLTRGFAREIVDGISDEGIRNIASERVEAALAHLHPSARTRSSESAPGKEEG